MVLYLVLYCLVLYLLVYMALFIIESFIVFHDVVTEHSESLTSYFIFSENDRFLEYFFTNFS